MTRNWVTNSDVMAEYMGFNSAAELPCPISKCNHIKELTKALSDIKREIGLDNFEEDGNTLKSATIIQYTIKGRFMSR